MDRIAKNIKLAREYKNLTQEFMAEAIGVSQATYCRIETGKTDIRVSVLRSIAKAFQVPFSRLVSDDVVDLIRSLQELQPVPHLNPNAPSKHSVLESK